MGTKACRRVNRDRSNLSYRFMQLSSQDAVFCLFYFCFYEQRLSKFRVSKFPTPAQGVLCGRSAFLQGMSPKILHSRSLLGRF